MIGVRLRALRSVMVAAVLLSPAIAFGAENAAHAIADKFAHDGDAAGPSADQDRETLQRKLEDEARLKADEADMLARAKAEDAQLKAGEETARREKVAKDLAAAEAARKADDAKRLAQDQQKANEQRLADEKAAQERDFQAAREREAKDASDHARVVEEQRVAAEKADIERRAADEQRLADERRKAEEDLAADKAARERAVQETARIKAAEQQRVATEKAAAEQREIEAAQGRIDEAQKADALRRMTAEREDEARRLSEKLTRAREQRAAKDLGPGFSALGNPPSEPAQTQAAPQGQAAALPMAPVPAIQPAEETKAVKDVALADTGETRATILLVMTAGTKGIRRYEKTGDPIICIGGKCYIGAGIENAATEMTRGRAFGPGTTLGQRAGACRHSLTCVFRDVDVGKGRFEIQPVDLRILRHDRREVVATEIDRTCTAVAGDVHCARTVQAGTYRAWIVPEGVARRAGASALTAAISQGLSTSTAADLQR